MFSGCVEIDGMTSDELLINIIEANKAVETFQFDSVIDMNALTIMPRMQTEMEMVLNGSDEVDVTNKKMQMVMTTQGGMFGMDMNTTAYIVDGVHYTHMELFGEGIWTKTEVG